MSAQPSDLTNSSATPYDLSWLQLSNISKVKLGLLAGGVILGLAAFGFLSSSGSDTDARQEQQSRGQYAQRGGAARGGRGRGGRGGSRGGRGGRGRGGSAATSRSNANLDMADEDEVNMSNLERILVPRLAKIETSRRDRKWKEVEAEYRVILEALEAHKSDPEITAYILDGLAESLSKQGLNREAEPYLLRAIDLLEASGNLIKRLEAQHTIIQLWQKPPEQADKAEELISKIFNDSRTPQNSFASFYIELAGVKALQNEFDKAQEIYQQVADKLAADFGANNQDSLFVRLNVASMLLYQGKREEGNKLFRDLVPQFENDIQLPTMLLYAYDLAARINWEMMNYEDADEFFTKYLEIFEQQPERDTNRSYVDIANFYWHINQPRKAENLYDTMRMLQKPPVVTSKILITKSCQLLSRKTEDSQEGVYYSLTLRFRIVRQKGVRRQYIIPKGAVLDIKYENLEREDGAPSEVPEFVQDSKKIEESHIKEGHITLESKVFSKIATLSRKVNFEAVVVVWEDASRTNKIGEHHQLVSTTSVPF